MKLNTALPDEEKIPVSFFSTTAEKPQSCAARIPRALCRTELPMAPAGTTQIHDVSFHSGAVFYPGFILKHASNQARHGLRYSDIVSQKAKDAGVDPAITKEFLKFFRLQYALQIDSGTGNLAYFLAFPTSGAATGSGRSKQAYQMGFVSLTSGGASAKQLLENRLRSALSNIETYHISRLSAVPPPDKETYDRERQSLNKLTRILGETIVDYNAAQSSDPDYSKEISVSEEEFCRMVRARRETLQKAAQSLTIP